jgi:F-type H+-transporting ATPase subunit c
MDIELQSLMKVAAFLGGGMAIGFGAIGAAVGEGHTAAQANRALSENPELSGDIVKTMLVGQAVAESAAIFALVVAVLLLFLQVPQPSLVKAASLVGAGLCIGFGAMGSGIGSGMPAAEACRGIARQPHLAGRLTTTMLVGSAVCQTPAILSMVVALMLMFINFGDAAVVKGVALFGAGLCMGLGAIGSGVGSGHPAGEACRGIARQPTSAGPLTANMLVGSAVTQTPAIFAMVVALMLMFINFGDVPFNPYWAAFLGAALSTGLSAIGSGYGCGLAAGASCEGIARQPRSAGPVTTMMLVGQAVAQTPCIFGLLISFVLMFKMFPETAALAPGMALVSAGLCMGFGGIGPGLGNGMTAEGAVRWVARQPEHASLLMRIMLVGQAVSQSTAIYAMVISLVLIFVI